MYVVCEKEVGLICNYLGLLIVVLWLCSWCLIINKKLICMLFLSEGCDVNFDEYYFFIDIDIGLGFSSMGVYYGIWELYRVFLFLVGIIVVSEQMM